MEIDFNINKHDVTNSILKVRAAKTKMDYSEVDISEEFNLPSGFFRFLLEIVEEILIFGKKEYIKPDGTPRKRARFWRVLKIAGFFGKILFKLLKKFT